MPYLVEVRNLAERCFSRGPIYAKIDVNYVPNKNKIN